MQNQKEQQDLQLAGVEERLQTLNKLRDTATHDRLQQERDLSRLRAELEASKAGVTKREAELTLAQQELARKEKHAAARRDCAPAPGVNVTKHWFRQERLIHGSYIAIDCRALLSGIHLNLGPSPPTSRSHHQVAEARRDAQVQRERAEKEGVDEEENEEEEAVEEVVVVGEHQEQGEEEEEKGL